MILPLSRKRRAPTRYRSRHVSERASVSFRHSTSLFHESAFSPRLCRVRNCLEAPRQNYRNDDRIKVNKQLCTKWFFDQLENNLVGMRSSTVICSTIRRNWERNRVYPMTTGLRTIRLVLDLQDQAIQNLIPIFTVIFNSQSNTVSEKN